MKALHVGETTITVGFSADEQVKETCTVEVIAKNVSGSVKLNKIYFDRDTYYLYTGETQSLNVMFVPSSATDKGITWTSSNTKIAQVTNGKVKAIGPGEAVVKAKSHDGGFEISTRIVVNNKDEKIAVKSIKFNTDNIDLNVGETFKLNVSYDPSNASDKKISWVSNNPGIASVKDGVITAVKEGTAIITAKSSNGKTANCKVTVSKKNVVVDVENISIVNGNLVIKVGKSAMVGAKISPDNATDKRITWASSDSSIVSVNEGGIVTGRSAGTVVITATASNGKKDSTLVTVLNEEVIPNAVSLNSTHLKIEKGKKETLIATVLPDSSTNKTITWSTSDKNVVVTAKKPGSAVITVTTFNGKTATCRVDVYDGNDIPVEGIHLNETSRIIYVNSKFLLSYTLDPLNATNRDVTWSSSDESIAVYKNGYVTGLKKGTAIITAKTANGKTATCEVIVKEIDVLSIELNQTEVNLKVSENVTIKAIVKPEDATNKTLTWVSNNPQVAEVDQNGVVTAKAEGEATITATSVNGKKAIAIIKVSK